MYKKDLALNNLQCLICDKTKPNHHKRGFIIYSSANYALRGLKHWWLEDVIFEHLITTIPFQLIYETTNITSMVYYPCMVDWLANVDRISTHVGLWS